MTHQPNESTPLFTLPSRTYRDRRVLSTVSVSVLLGLVSGTLYGFGRYSRALKDILGLSQLQIQRFGILLDTGNYVGHPVTGYVYDHFGPRVSCLSAALIVFLSYGAIHLSVDGHSERSSDESLVVFDVGFFMVGFGSGLGYIAALGSATRTFQSTPHLGRAIGLVAAGYGLCSTIVGITYHVVGLEFFFLLWAILVAVVNVLGAYVLPSPQEEAEANGENTDKQTENDGGSVAMTTLDLEENKNTISLGRRLVRMASRRTIDVRPLLDSLSTWRTWTKLDFWLLFASFACTTGCGLFVINNISTMVQSIGGEDSFSGILVFLLSICNCVGRIIMGMLADQPRLSKVALFRGVSLLMAVALFVSAAARTETALVSLIVTVAIAAMAYGASWVLIVGVLAEWFGNVDFGKDYGLMAMGPALSGMIFNAASAWIYQQHAYTAAPGVDEGGADLNAGICLGLVCYRGAYLLTGTAAVVGCLLLSFVSVQ
uniref:Nodulin-like domain-containing protein n=1 Tax=Pseudictyota dubia TaxID=2749911 RepID=A0A7R9WAM0_9STRA|mmetsp:Transcript_41767/g.77280  ORF Transcript_41767/g.77280 Transcript_41767/m.77280 type:complete len:486 (+) Transcript_41767:92-1549(+)